MKFYHTRFLSLWGMELIIAGNHCWWHHQQQRWRKCRKVIPVPLLLAKAVVTKTQITKFTSAKSLCFIQTILYWEFKDLMANSVVPDDAAHDELPHRWGSSYWAESSGSTLFANLTIPALSVNLSGRKHVTSISINSQKISWSLNLKRT